MKLTETEYRAFLFVALAFAGCGRVTRATAPTDDPTADGGAPAPVDAALASDSDTLQAVDAGIDATRPSTGDADSDAAGENDDAESRELDGAADADAEETSLPIACAEAATCSDPIVLPIIYSGVSAAPGEITSTLGNHSEWYLVEVDPYPNATVTAEVALIAITPPPDAEFDLEVYASNYSDYPNDCSTPACGSTGAPGQFQETGLNWMTVQGFSPREWLTVHVIAAPGTHCETGKTWKLSVSGG